MSLSPREVYAERLAGRQSALARLEREHARTSRARGLVFVGFVALAYAAIDRELLSPAWLALPTLGFVALVLRHGRLVDERDRLRLATGFHERGLARLDGSWRASGPDGSRFLPASHDYAVDLDVLGEGSLFRLLCTAATPLGQETLARWLLDPATPAEVQARQEAVAELRDDLDRRETFWIAAGAPEEAADPGPLIRWGHDGDAGLAPRWIPLVAAALAGASALALVASALALVPAQAFVATLLAELLFLGVLRGRLGDTMRGIDRRVDELRRVSRLLERLEAERFTTARLESLRGRLESDGATASQCVRRLCRWLELYDSGRNLLFLPIALLLLWPLLTGHAIARWRRRHGPQIEAWLRATGEVEALASLAAHAFDHPEDRFPKLAARGPLLDALGIAHPLLASEVEVRNDLRLDSDQPALIVSGSNMSGKSTLLRAVGVNAVLAFAGGTVRAHRLEISGLAIGASLRVQDSLLDGRSRFQAEIVRLRRLVDLADGPCPLLFLLDEVLAGTNSHDRRIGAEHLLRGLLRRGAIGLVTTHDLALAEIADGPTPMKNVHFEDRLEGDRIHFDYRLRPGVVRVSNALELMRAVGLEVPTEPRPRGDEAS